MRLFVELSLSLALLMVLPPLLMAAQWVIFPERIAFVPILRQENAPEIGMTREIDAEHVVALALQPVGGCPEVGRGRDAVAAFERIDAALDAQPVAVFVEYN